MRCSPQFGFWMPVSDKKNWFAAERVANDFHQQGLPANLVSISGGLARDYGRGSDTFLVGNTPSLDVRKQNSDWNDLVNLIADHESYNAFGIDSVPSAWRSDLAREAAIMVTVHQSMNDYPSGMARIEPGHYLLTRDPKAALEKLMHDRFEYLRR